MVLRGLRALRIGAMAIGLLWALGACGSCAVSSLQNAVGQPSKSDLAGAGVSGHWRLTVTVDQYTGPAPPAGDIFKPGHVGVDDVVLVRQCVSAGQCALQVWGPAGPDPTQQAYFAFYSNTTSLLGPPVRTPMNQNGDSYSQVIPVSGFGGARCPPSPTVHAPVQQLTLTIAGAARGASGWTADRMTGTEEQDAGWGCSGGAFSGWTIEHLSIVGRPA